MSAQLHSPDSSEPLAQGSKGLSSAQIVRSAPPGPRLHRGLFLVLLLTLHLSQRFSWPGVPGPQWFPSAGLGVALLAWLGPRALVLLVLDAFLAALQQQGFGQELPAGPGWRGLGGAVLDQALQAGALALGWALFQRGARGSRVLGDPRSLVLFLLLVPGVALGVGSVFWLVLCGGTLPLGVEGWREVGLHWTRQALGVIALAPPLLVCVTPWLVRRGILAASESSGEGNRLKSSVRLVSGAPPPRTAAPSLGFAPTTVGEWIEIAGLALTTAGLSLLLLKVQGPVVGRWQVWGVPLLVIVWAGLRQGLWAATIAVAAGTVVPLEALAHQADPLLLQGNLLAHCAALLVASSVSWMRSSEARYRRVAAQIPVVLYSARVLPSGDVSQDWRNPRAEVIFVSPPCRTILGKPPAALLGDHAKWMGCVHPDDREVVQAAILQLYRQNLPVTCEYRLAALEAETPPGHLAPAFSAPRWVRETLVPHLDHEGQLEGWEGMVQEISEQRSLADDLRRTTNMFHALVSSLPAGVFFVQAPHGNPIFVNARARQLLGQRENLSLGLEHLVEYYRLHRPDGTSYPLEELPVYKALHGGAAGMREDIVVHRLDGERTPLVTWAAPIHLAQSGKADAAVWVLEDLTSLRRAEAARKESETRLRAVIESLTEGLLVQDRTGHVLDCNKAAATLLGCSHEDVVGRALTLGFSSAQGTPLPPQEHPFALALKTRRPVRDRKLGYLCPSGANGAERRILLVNALPLLLAPGTPPIGVVTTLVDMTEQLRTQERIRFSEERYRGLVDSLPLMLVQLDAQLRVVYANPATETLTGFTPAQLQQGGLVATLTLQSCTAIDVYAEALAGRSTRGECRFVTRDQQERIGYQIVQPWREVSTKAVASEGVLVLLVDMTRERRLQRELERSQRLELIGRLSSGIAHDFNNLLMAMMGLAQLAREHVGNAHPAATDLDRLSEVGEQAANMAQRLLDFSRQRQVPLQRLEINRVIRRACDLLRTLMPTNITLEALVPPDSLLVRADEMQLQQVLMNLCLNARDAMPHGGRLMVHLQAMRDPALAPLVATKGETAHLLPLSWVRLAVHDNGTGMTEEVRKRIFDPFFTTKEYGSGLGLAVVQQIVAGFGGQLRVISEPDFGSRFEVWLPRFDPKAKEAQS